MITEQFTIKLPQKLGKGRATLAQKEKYNQDLINFAEGIKELKSSLDIQVSARGWCYLLENKRVINKDGFDLVTQLITECRKKGLLPLNICAEDLTRSIENKDCSPHTSEPQEYLKSAIESISYWCNHYNPLDFWENQKYQLFLAVEKIDLKGLFEPICRKYHIPYVNFKGWADINSRVNLIQQFKEAERCDRIPVLLYCGDFDPAGLNISTHLRKNFNDLSEATKWQSDNLIIDRFGLNYDFIQSNNLLWIDNLTSGSGKDLSKSKEQYIIDYIANYGIRKCESNVLITIPTIARQLFETTVNNYVTADSVTDYEARLKEARSEIKKLYEEFKEKIES